jgi:hypothetical protein
MTFVHRFSRSLSATMIISNDPPVHGESCVQNVEWTGHRKMKHLPEYVRWSHEIYRYLANHWNLRLMQAFEMSPGRWEFWIYDPGEAPKRLQS